MVIAKTIKGQEYFHSIREMYEVPKRSTEKICEIMNHEKWNLKDNEAWHIYDDPLTDPAGELRIRNGNVKLKLWR